MLTRIWSTQEVAPAEQLDAWADVVSNAFVPLVLQRRDTTSSFRARLRSTPLAGMTISHISAEAHSVRRTPRLAQRTDSEPYYKLCLHASGTALLSQDGRTLRMRPGDLAIYDTSRPYHLVFDGPYSHRVLLIPRQRLCTRQDDIRALTAVAHPTDSGVERLLAESIRQLDRHAEELTAPQVYAAMCGVINLLDATLESWLGHADDDRGFAGALSYIDQHLQDLNLTPASVAASQFISLRWLQAMFARHGLTPSGWIRQRRLEMCRHELIAASARSRTVSEIARSWGFLDSAHFSRAFKGAFGMSPREARPSMPSVRRHSA